MDVVKATKVLTALTPQMDCDQSDKYELHRVILLERRLRLTCVLLETSASSGRTKRLFHRKLITTIDAIEHVLNVANS
jgi:hypothetical protein